MAILAGPACRNARLDRVTTKAATAFSRALACRASVARRGTTGRRPQPKAKVLVHDPHRPRTSGEDNGRVLGAAKEHADGLPERARGFLRNFGGAAHHAAERVYHKGYADLAFLTRVALWYRIRRTVPNAQLQHAACAAVRRVNRGIGHHVARCITEARSGGRGRLWSAPAVGKQAYRERGHCQSNHWRKSEGDGVDRRIGGGPHNVWTTRTKDKSGDGRPAGRARSASPCETGVATVVPVAAAAIAHPTRPIPLHSRTGHRGARQTDSTYCNTDCQSHGLTRAFCCRALQQVAASEQSEQGRNL